MKCLPLILILLSFLNASEAASLEPAIRGNQIAVEYDRREAGFQDFTADLEMQLQDQSGRVSNRRLRALTLEVDNLVEGERRILVFDHPQDVKGTVILTVSNRERTDDQWIYFPAYKRVKRISSANKAGAFMGSEFSYEDLGSPEVAKYDYLFLRDDPCDGEECYVFERYPKYDDSGYKRQTLWVDKTNYRLKRVEYFDRKDQLLKVLTITGYHEYMGRFWKADFMEMQNLQTGKKTRLIWSNYSFKTNISPSEFQSSSIGRRK